VKTARLSLVIGTRTSQPAATVSELEQAERTIENRRQQLLYAIARMNGAKAVAESLAKKRLFFSSLPAMAEPDRTVWLEKGRFTWPQSGAAQGKAF